MTDLELIHPDRGAKIRRAALRHAGRMILVSAGEWEPKKYAPDDARTDAEADLLIDEVEKIGLEILSRLLIGTLQPCSVCENPHRVRHDGTMRHHDTLDEDGFRTGRTCPGYSLPPAAAALDWLIR